MCGRGQDQSEDGLSPFAASSAPSPSQLCSCAERSVRSDVLFTAHREELCLEAFSGPDPFNVERGAERPPGMMLLYLSYCWPGLEGG